MSCGFDVPATVTRSLTPASGADRRVLAVSIFIAIVLAATGCRESPAEPSAPAVASIVILVPSPTASILDGTVHQLEARLLDSSGKVLTGRIVTWRSSDTAVAMVSASGLMNALLPGSTTIAASSEGVSANVDVVVLPRYLFTRLATGAAHTCGLTSDGTAMCWGANASGELGRSTTESCVPVGEVTAVPCSRSPGAVEGGQAFVTLAAGRGSHTCGLTAAGEAWCWGRNDAGQLGDGTTTTRSAPVLVAGGVAFASIATGPLHTCALTAGGQAYCWGEGAHGQLGRAVASDPHLPAPVATEERLVALALGNHHTCAVAESRMAYCWGINQYGQLGDGSRENRAIPAMVLGSGYSAITAGRYHTCAIAGDAAWCWGLDFERELGASGAVNCSGTSTWVPCSAVPLPVMGELRFRGIAAGHSFTCGLAQDGAAACWGSDYYENIGEGMGRDLKAVPTRVASGSLKLTAITAGASHACALATNGATYCWGLNDRGQLGAGPFEICSSSVGSFRCSPVPMLLRGL